MIRTLALRAPGEGNLDLAPFHVNCFGRHQETSTEQVAQPMVAKASGRR